MSGRDTPSPSPRPSSTASSKPNIASRTLLTDHCIRRIATEPSIVLGSFYDARTESIVGRLSLDNKAITKNSQTRDIRCEVMKADKSDREDIFRTIEIHEEPWLNSILNIVPPQGITGLIKYAFSRSSSIRYLYYYYCSEEQSISQTTNIVKAVIPKDMPAIATTHVVSMMKVGVQAFIVLQLLPDGDANLDSFLKSTAEKLSEVKFQISTNEKPLFDRILVTKVFSNIPTISTLSTFADICQQLTDIIPHPYHHYPLEFQLCTIKWFYPSYPTSKTKYIALESETVRTIRQYLQSFSSQIEELKTLLDPEDKQTLQKHLNDQYRILRQQIKEAEQTYSNELKRIHDLIIQVRSGIIQQELIIKRLSNEFNESLRKNINPLVECVESLRKKAKLIKTLNEGKIKYLSMQRYSIHENDDLKTNLRKLCQEDNTTYVFCSTDEIKDHDSSKWDKQCEKWIKKHESNPSLAFVYADFTYASYHLSKVKILEIKSTGNSDKQVESSYSKSPSVPETTDLAREQPVNPLIEIDSTDTKSTSPREKLPTNTNEKPKSSQSSAQSTSEVSNTFNDQSKETERLIHSAFPPDESTAQTATPKTEQEDDAKKRTDISPAPSAEKDKQIASSESTCQSPRLHNIASSNEPTYHGGDQCDTPPLSMVSRLPITSRERRRKAGVEESSTSAITAESSSAKPPVSSEQLYRPDAHNSVPSVSESLKAPPREKGERPTSATVITSSTSKLEKASKEQSKNIDERPRLSSATGSTETKTRSSRKNELVKVDEHTIQQSSSARPTSDISIALNQQNGNSRESFDLSNSSKQFDADKTSLPVKHSVSRYNSTNQTESLASSASQNISRQRRRSTIG